MKLQLRKSKIQDKDDNFLPIIKRVFYIARFIGVCDYGFSIDFIWSISLLLTLLTIVIASIWKVIRLLSGVSNNTSGGLVNNIIYCMSGTSMARLMWLKTLFFYFFVRVKDLYLPRIPAGEGAIVGRLSGSIFYGNALFSLIFSMRFVSSWTELSLLWLKANTTTGLNLPPDVKIRRRVIFVTSLVTICTCVEHMMSMMSATGFDIPPEEYFYRYIISSHGFLLHTYEYTLWLAVPIFIMSKIATLLWNFQDLIIILISMGLASRYHRLNMYVNYVVRFEKRFKDVRRLGTDVYIQVQVWRRVREAYVRQAALVRQVNHKLGALILLSNINNLYFICLQLFFGIGNERGSIINRAYYFLSLGWLLFRACSVVLAASDVHVHSKRALPNLYSCPGSGYNIEIKRLINQLKNDDVSLSGMGLFSLNRNLLLQVVAAVLKYELVLIQYDYN